ncbi:hypothetical protein DFH07DRAFT_965335 [Mycena maculata]|uniref:Uncharacterized protein n=1 Tax=Mycena maculata TaxID=230809 RepID=A0AAD7IDB9_9AGAR|nr:hypothetical protein DFH07DRAFT_965335 [Mycena maculata]
MTVQRALHVLFPEQTSGWNFSLGDDTENSDRKVFQHFIWSYSGPGTSTAFTPLGNIPHHPLVIGFQPPWILSPKDMLEFTECRAFPRLDSEHGSAALDGAERLWANVWDTCVVSKTRWFALTSYDQWVFGLFSEGRWTIGFVSRVYQFDACHPTVLEVLAFWVACAARLPGWQGLPKVDPQFIFRIGLEYKIWLGSRTAHRPSAPDTPSGFF